MIDDHPGRPPVWYGADYYPEQWDERTIAQDIGLMGEAGVTLVTLGVFSWAELQPTPDAWDLDWLDGIITRLGDAGIAVDLATPTASVPAWLADLDPELASVDASGLRRTGGTRGYHCPSSPTYKAAVRVIVERLAARFGGRAEVVMWHVGNEFGPTECFCTRCAEAFREWLRRRYRDIDALNEAWGTTFWSLRMSDWRQVMPPRVTTDFHMPGRLVDWSRFHSDLLLEQFMTERDLLRSGDPSTPIFTNFMGLYPKLDYWAWADQADAVGNDCYPDPADPRAARIGAFDSDLMRSLARGKPFLQTEQAVSAVQWRAVNTPKRPRQFQLWSMQTVARGASGVLQFQWRASVAGAETFHSAMVPHAGPGGERWAEVVELGSRIAGLDLAADAPVDAHVAIVLDWSSLWARRSTHGPDDREPDAETRRWHAGLFENGVAVDFVAPWHDLSRYRLVVLPSLFLVTPDFAAALDRYVADGGHVVATYLTGVVDERVHAHPGAPGPLTEMLGVRVQEHWPLPDRAVEPPPASARVSASIVVPAPGGTLAGSWSERDPGRPVVTYSGFAESITVTDASVVMTFAGGDLAGKPAITRRGHGLGRATYVAARIDEASLIELVGRLVDDAGVQPTVPDLPPGVEAVRRGGLLFLLNHSDAPASVSVGSGWRGPDDLEGSVDVPGRSTLVLHTEQAPEGRERKTT